MHSIRTQFISFIAALLVILLLLLNTYPLISSRDFLRGWQERSISR